MNLSSLFGKRFTCCSCGITKNKKHFEIIEQQRQDSNPQCKDCYQRELYDPRPCSACLQGKAQDHYSIAQWNKGYEFDNRKCLDCYPAPVEDWNRAKQECIKARDNGYQFYVYPNPDHVPFAPMKLNTLPGVYDIVFHRGWHMCGDESRTTQGTLTLKRNANGTLGGSILRPPGLTETSMLGVFGVDFTFQQDNLEVKRGKISAIGCKITSSNNSKQSLEIINNHMNAWPSMQSKPACVEIRQINKRMVCPWQCREEYCTDHQEAHNVPQDLSLLQAEELLQQHKDVCCSQSWITKHLKLDPFISQLVHSFVAGRPTPVVFLEPGDFCITTEWNQSFHFDIISHFICRRRPGPFKD